MKNISMIDLREGHMKINWNTKYTTIALYSFLVICSVMIFYLSLSQLEALLGKVSEVILVLQPFIMGVIIAYLLNFILKFYENVVFETKIFKKMKLKKKRGLGLLLTYITAFALIALFIQFVLPQVIDSIVGLINDIPTYIEKSNRFINESFKNIDLSPRYQEIVYKNVNGLIDYILKFATECIPVIGNLIRTIASSIWNIIIGLIISIYILMEKEKFIGMSRKITIAILPLRSANKIMEIAHRSNTIFGKFLGGKILDSSIIGILTFIILTITNMPYTLLVSVIVGITNIIPFFGPFIGAVPSFIIIVFVSPIKAIWFLIIILIIQQIDGNIIGPKILGDSVGLSAFWILFAIMVAGKFMGVLGMVIGVPIFAVIYSLIKEFIENRLDKKGLAKDTKDYM